MDIQHSDIPVVASLVFYGSQRRIFESFTEFYMEEDLPNFFIGPILF